MVRLNLCPSRIFTNEEQKVMDKKRRKREREDISKLTGVTPSVSREELVERTHEGPSKNPRQGEMSADGGAAVNHMHQGNNDSPTMEAGTTISTSRLGADATKILRRSPRTSQGSAAAKVKASASRNSLGQRSVPEDQGDQQYNDVQQAKSNNKRTKKSVEGKQAGSTKGIPFPVKKKGIYTVAKPSKGKPTTKRGQKGKRPQGNNGDVISSFSSIFAAYKMPKTISTMELRPSTYDALAPQDVSADPAGGDVPMLVERKPKVGEAASSKADKGVVSQDVSAVEKDSPAAKSDKPPKKKNANAKPIVKKKTGKVVQKPKAIGKGAGAKKEKASKRVQKPKQGDKKQKAAHATRKPKQSVKPPTAKEKAAIRKIKSLLSPFPKKKGHQVSKLVVNKRKHTAAPKVVKRKKTAA